MSRRLIILICLTIGMLAAAALLSSGSAQEIFSATPTPVPMDTSTQMEIPGPKDYGVPVEYVNLVNPVAADDASLQRGEEIYQANCIRCHGEDGRGDGPIADRQNPKPSDYRADHVMELSDGELFYIITHGMRTWGFFDEETRWDLVNTVRAFQE